MTPANPSPPLPKLILASQSPRRRQLLTEAGLSNRGHRAGCGCGMRNLLAETPPEMVARLAFKRLQM